jgi:hypothetical protein
MKKRKKTNKEGKIIEGKFPQIMSPEFSYWKVPFLTQENE